MYQPPFGQGILAAISCSHAFFSQAPTPTTALASSKADNTSPHLLIMQQHVREGSSSLLHATQQQGYDTTASSPMTSLVSSQSEEIDRSSSSAPKATDLSVLPKAAQAPLFWPAPSRTARSSSSPTPHVLHANSTQQLSLSYSMHAIHTPRAKIDSKRRTTCTPY